MRRVAFRAATTVPQKRRRRGSRAVGAVAMSVALLAVAPSARGATCTDFRFIGARGSGEAPQPGRRGDAANLGMGPEVADVYHALASLLPGRVSAEAVDYPAVELSITTLLGAGLHVGFLGRYTDSVREGTRAAVRELEQAHRRCPAMRFVLAGYSQGAQAVGDALQRMSAADRGLVAGAAFFGDPYFNANSWSSRSSYDPTFYGALGARGEWQEPLHGRVFSYCHRYDPVCNLSNRYHIFGDGDVYVRNFGHIDRKAHESPAYRSTAEHGRGDADDAARELARVLGATTPAAPYGGPLDIAFVIDSTGSMADVIDQVKSNVAALVAAIAAADANFRIALVDYKDDAANDSAYQARVDASFTTSLSVFGAALSSLTAEGGGDPPESVYSGLMTAFSLNWRVGAKKLVVLIGDAPAKDPEPVTSYTLATVRAKALSLDPAVVDTLLSGSSIDAASSFSVISAATAGTAYSLPAGSAPGLIATIVTAVRRSATAPTAVLTPPSHAVVGAPATFSAGASVDRGEPIAGYDWDFNGDGVYDTSTTDPVTAFTYPAPFSGTVVLRVRARSGLAALATAHLTVRAGADRRPHRPRRLRARAGRHTIRLTCRAGRGPAAQWFTLRGRRGRPVVRVAARRGGRAPRKVVLRGLPSGRRYRFTVSAGNQRGESRRSRPISTRTTRARRHHS